MPLGQLQIGLWLMTRHSAFSPQTPGQGSLHFWLMQACEAGHSELVCFNLDIDNDCKEICLMKTLTKHSGRQSGGMPLKPGWQEQTALLSTSLQMLFGPHGVGVHGRGATTGVDGRGSAGIGRQALEASPV